MRSLDWKRLVWKIIHGNTCLWLVKKEPSIFNVQRSTFFQILYCVSVRYTRTVNVPRAHSATYTTVCSTFTTTTTTNGLALSRCHPGHRDTPVGPVDTHSTPVPERGGCGWPSTNNTTHVVRRSTGTTSPRCWHGSGAEGSKCSQDPAQSRSRYTAFSRSRAAERQRDREAFTEGPIKAIAEFTTVGRSHMQERDNSHQHTRREVTCDSDDTRDSKTSQQYRTNQGTTQWRMCVNTWIYGSYHAVALENSETAKQSTISSKETFLQSQRREKHSAAQLKTTVPHSGAGGLTANRLTSEAPDHTVAMFQDQTEKTSSLTADHVVVNYHTVTQEYLPRTNDHEVAQTE